MKLGPQQLNGNRQVKKLKSVLRLSREALLPFAGFNPLDVTGADLANALCHVGIRMKDEGRLMGPHDCGRCGRELAARRALVEINEALPGE